MLLSPTDEQTHIAEAVADSLREEAPFDKWFMARTNMLDEESRLLRFGAQMGWIGFGISPDAGGSGASVIEEMLVSRELGARLAPLGIVPAMIAARMAEEAGKVELVAAILSGDAGVAMSAGAEGTVLLGAAGAKCVLIVDGADLRLSALAGEATVRLGWDGMVSSAAHAGLPRHDNAVPATRETVGRFRLLVAAQLQGIARTAVAESAAYAKVREQFGRAIGSFQAVRHRVADMEMASRRAEAALYYAAASLEEGRADADFQVLTALILSLEAALGNAQANIANHGAIGVTEENIAHLLLKRVLLWRSIMGGVGALLDELALKDRPLV